MSNKIFLVIFLLIYILAMLYIVQNPCDLSSIENCSLSGTLGLAYMTIWLLMAATGLYFMYLAIASLKYGVYSSEKLLLMHKTKPVTGKEMYIYCLIFVVGGLAFILLPVFWWDILGDTIAEYNYLFPGKQVDVI